MALSRTVLRKAYLSTSGAPMIIVLVVVVVIVVFNLLAAFQPSTSCLEAVLSSKRLVPTLIAVPAPDYQNRASVQ